MTSATATKPRKERASVLAPMKVELQKALFDSLMAQNPAQLEITIKALLERDNARAKTAWDEVIEPLRAQNSMTPAFRAVIESLAPLIEPTVRIPNVTRVGRRRTMLVIPNEPGLEDVGAVKLSTIQNAGGKRLIVLEPLTEAEYSAMCQGIAQQVPNPTLTRAA